MKIAVATCLNLPEFDPDEQLTLGAFRDRGHDVELVAWDDPSADFGAFDVTVIRSTWNYPYEPVAFAEWVQTAASVSKLLNPADVVLGNMHKRYLLELAAQGLPVVPTQIFRADAFEPSMLSERSVIKPAIGAGSWDTKSFRVEETDAALSWLRTMAGAREFLIQPYFDSVHSVGEQSIVVIGGEPTHTVTKRPRFAGQDESVEGPFPVSPEFDASARKALERFGTRLAYARLDLMQSPDGVWSISELELIEPSLFLLQNPAAAERLADIVETALAI